MGYEKYYSGGWKSGEAGGTPITPEALNHMEDGIEVAADHADSTSNPHKVTAAQAGAVPTSRTVNGKALSANVSLAASDVGALNLKDITDNAHLVSEGADLNDYTSPDAYRIATAAIAKSLKNAPPYGNSGGRLIVSATSSASGGVIQIIIYNTVYYQLWFRVQTSTGAWGEWLPISNNAYKTIWKNASDSSGFGAQTLSVDLSGCVAIMFVFKQSAHSTSRLATIYVSKTAMNGRKVIMAQVDGGTDGSVVYFERYVTLNFDAGTVVFEDAKKQKDTVVNEKMIPVEIVGIRGQIL